MKVLLLQPQRIGVPVLLSAGPALTRLLSLPPFKEEEAFALIIPPPFFLILIFFMSIQLEGFEGKSDASLPQPGRLPTGPGSIGAVRQVPGVAALGANKTFWEGTAFS